LRTLAAALSEARDALEDVIEPYLIQQGYLMRTPRGRVATKTAWRRLGLKIPKEVINRQQNLFPDEEQDDE